MPIFRLAQVDIKWPGNDLSVVYVTPHPYIGWAIGADIEAMSTFAKSLSGVSPEAGV